MKQKKSPSDQIRLDIVTIIKEMANDYKSQSLAMHIALAVSEYGDMSQMTDKEFQYALAKYKVEKDLGEAFNIMKSIDETLDVEDLYDEDEF